MAKRSDTVSGVLNVDKPSGWTSHDVVARMRGIAQQRRVGHAGTLDPMATGVLVVCLGKATRLSEYLVQGHKRYRATIRFGLTTDTWDMDGQPLETRPLDGLSEQDLVALLPRQSGEIEQTPPMYSAIKVNGQPLHRLARKGITVERAPRRVEIHALTPISWESPDLLLDVECSKGTYVRSLAYDLGQLAGCGATLAALRRTAVGPFDVLQATPLDQLWDERGNDGWQRHLTPLYQALAEWPRIIVGAEALEELRFGRPAALPISERPDMVAVFDSNRQLAAIVAPQPESELWRPSKVFTQ